MLMLAATICLVILAGLIIGTTLLSKRFVQHRSKIQAAGIVSYLTFAFALAMTIFSFNEVVSIADDRLNCTSTTESTTVFPLFVAKIDVSRGSGLNCAGPAFVRYNFHWDFGGLMIALAICLIAATLFYFVISRIQSISPIPTPSSYRR